MRQEAYNPRDNFEVYQETTRPLFVAPSAPILSVYDEVNQPPPAYDEVTRLNNDIRDKTNMRR
jgi:hypothetical protein